MKRFITCLFLIFVLTSQTVVPKTKVQTETSLTKGATKEPYTFDSLQVWKSSKGSLFVVRKSKKTAHITSNMQFCSKKLSLTLSFIGKS